MKPKRSNRRNRLKKTELLARRSSLGFSLALAGIILMAGLNEVQAATSAAPAAGGSLSPYQFDLPPGESESSADFSDFSDSAVLPVARPTQLELAASSWAPAGLNLPSDVPAVSVFKPANLPLSGIGFVVPVGDSGRGLDLAFRSGISAIRLRRTGSDTFQDMFLMPVQFGIEARPRKLRLKALSFYGGGSVLPLLALTQRSSIDEGRTFFGFAGEVCLGLEANLSFVASFLERASLTVEGHSTAGTLSGEIIKASGVRGALRVRI